MIFIIDLILAYILLSICSKAKYIGLVAYVISAAIIATIECTQTIIVCGYELNGGCIPFACLFLATDVCSELYDKKKAIRLILYSGVAIIAFSVIMLLVSFYNGVSESFADIFRGTTLRVAITSVVVYMICSWVDVKLYHLIGSVCKYKWVRNNVCTIISQFLNAALFIPIAVGGGIEMIISNTILSSILAIIDTPTLYLITGKDEKIL